MSEKELNMRNEIDYVSAPTYREAQISNREKCTGILIRKTLLLWKICNAWVVWMQDATVSSWTICKNRYQFTTWQPALHYWPSKSLCNEWMNVIRDINDKNHRCFISDYVDNNVSSFLFLIFPVASHCWFFFWFCIFYYYYYFSSYWRIILNINDTDSYRNGLNW